MPILPSTHAGSKPATRVELLDRLAGTIGPLVATRPFRFIALLCICAAYIQGGLTKLFDFSAAVAEAQSFGLPFAVPASAATIVTELAGSTLILSGGTNPNIGRRLIATVAMFIGASLGAVLIFHVNVSAALAVAVALLMINAIAGYRLSSSTAAWTAAK